MERLSKWLEKRGKDAEEKALDYLNNRGFYCKNTKLGAREQIKEIEKSNSRDLYFKDCERKLKNNIRQKISSDKHPNMKQSTFRISESSHEILKTIAQHHSLTIGQTLERLIQQEKDRILNSAQSSNYGQHPYANYGNGYGYPAHGFGYSQPLDGQRYSSSNIGHILKILEGVKNTPYIESNQHYGGGSKDSLL
ncbi:hypothetical protein SAMN02745148_01040 [Modicisalibacter ilicicola DSM 19980]|uniref:Uncharacterized protein n=1 Tax=Modicisalibacter ilicicola DSM 19980 TaxID=1121942 RepID=A0A1M4W178_9GAMM|nr:hypothetical protein [Halomonas ilicicola]SHE75054.1 hypothetical protein SAMN02745148_01040 [Halomonas ilicicola DSM 19980]